MIPVWIEASSLMWALGVNIYHAVIAFVGEGEYQGRVTLNEPVLVDRYPGMQVSSYPVYVCTVFPSQAHSVGGCVAVGYIRHGIVRVVTAVPGLEMQKILKREDIYFLKNVTCRPPFEDQVLKIAQEWIKQHWVS